MKKGLFVLVALATLLFVSCEKETINTQNNNGQNGQERNIDLVRPDMTSTFYLRDMKVDIVNNEGNVYATKTTAFLQNSNTNMGIANLPILPDGDSYTLKVYNEAGDTLIATNQLTFDGDGLINSPLIIEPGLNYTVTSSTECVQSSTSGVIEYRIFILL
jgi:hypothetical protein